MRRPARCSSSRTAGPAAHPPLAVTGCGPQGERLSAGLLLHASLAVPLEVVEYPRAAFMLIADHRVALALPVPAQLSTLSLRPRGSRATNASGGRAFAGISSLSAPAWRSPRAPARAWGSRPPAPSPVSQPTAPRRRRYRQARPRPRRRARRRRPPLRRRPRARPRRRP